MTFAVTVPGSFLVTVPGSPTPPSGDTVLSCRQHRMALERCGVAVTPPGITLSPVSPLVSLSCLSRATLWRACKPPGAFVTTRRVVIEI